MDSLFFFPFLFFLTMAPQVLEKKIALLFTYRKIVIIFKSVELEHTPSSFPQSKRWSATMQSQKKKKGSSRRIYSCFFTHDGITTPKTTRESQESTTKTSLHLAWPPKFMNEVLFTPRAQSRFLDLGLLLRGCRPKSRSLPCRVEVIHPVVRACTTFLAYFYADYFDAGTPAWVPGVSSSRLRPDSDQSRIWCRARPWFVCDSLNELTWVSFVVHWHLTIFFFFFFFFLSFR